MSEMENRWLSVDDQLVSLVMECGIGVRRISHDLFELDNEFKFGRDVK